MGTETKSTIRLPENGGHKFQNGQTCTWCSCFRPGSALADSLSKIASPDEYCSGNTVWRLDQLKSEIEELRKLLLLQESEIKELQKKVRSSRSGGMKFKKDGRTGPYDRGANGAPGMSNRSKRK